MAVKGVAREKGTVLTIEFLIVSMLLIFFVFGVLDYWLLQVRVQQAEHIKNYYLNRIRVEGYLTPQDRDRLVNDMKIAGFTVKSVDAPWAPVVRNVQNPEGSEVWLTVEAEMDQKLFVLGVLLGAPPPNTLTLRFSGRDLSEYVAP